MADETEISSLGGDGLSPEGPAAAAPAPALAREGEVNGEANGEEANGEGGEAAATTAALQLPPNTEGNAEGDASSPGAASSAAGGVGGAELTAETPDAATTTAATAAAAAAASGAVAAASAGGKEEETASSAAGKEGETASSSHTHTQSQSSSSESSSSQSSQSPARATVAPATAETNAGEGNALGGEQQQTAQTQAPAQPTTVQAPPLVLSAADLAALVETMERLRATGMTKGRPFALLLRVLRGQIDGSAKVGHTDTDADEAQQPTPMPNGSSTAPASHESRSATMATIVAAANARSRLLDPAEAHVAGAVAALNGVADGGVTEAAEAAAARGGLEDTAAQAESEVVLRSRLSGELWRVPAKSPVVYADADTDGRDADMADAAADDSAATTPPSASRDEIRLKAVAQYFTASGARLARIAASQLLNTTLPGAEQIFIANERYAMSTYQMSQLGLQLHSMRFLQRNAPLPDHMMRAVRAFGAGARQHRLWLLKQAVQRTGVLEETGPRAAQLAEKVRASGAALLGSDRGLKHMKEITALLSLQEGSITGTVSATIPLPDQKNVLNMARMRDNRVNKKILARMQELQALLHPPPEPRDLENRIEQERAAAKRATERVLQLNEEKNRLEQAGEEHAGEGSDPAPDQSAELNEPSAAGDEEMPVATTDEAKPTGEKVADGDKTEEDPSSQPQGGAPAVELSAHGADAQVTAESITTDDPQPNTEPPTYEFTELAPPPEYPAMLPEHQRIQALVELKSLQLVRVQRQVRKQLVDDSRRQLVLMAMRESACAGSGSGSGYSATGAPYAPAAPTGKGKGSVHDTPRTFAQFTLKRTRGRGRDKALHALDTAQDRRKKASASGDASSPGSVTADTAMTSAAGMLARVQARAAARRERHFDFLQTVSNHHKDFSDWHQSRARVRKKICREVLDWHNRRLKKKSQAEDSERRRRLEALKANDSEEYKRLLSQTKNARLNSLIEQTENFMKEIAARVDKVKLTDQIAEQRLRRAKGSRQKDSASSSAAADDAGAGAGASSVNYLSATHSVSEVVTEQPKSMKFGQLKSYQLTGLNWLVSLYNNHLNGILADEMGLGKTIQTISLIAYLMEVKGNFGPFLVIVPLSTMSNWTLEFARWLPECAVCEYKGLPDDRKSLFKEVIHTRKCNVVLTSYEMCIKDEKSLNKVEWQHLIIDEGHRIKNTQSKLATVLRGFLSHHRLLLTGTPLQNDIGELWALLNFLLPSIFNNADAFGDWFSAPFSNKQGSGAVGAKDMDEEEQALEPTDEEKMVIIMQLHNVLRPFLMRRVKTEVEQELPDKQEVVLKCPMSAMQRSYYNLMVRDGIMLLDPTRNAGGKMKAKQGFNNTLMQLKKICNHPFLFLDEYELNETMVRVSGKFELLDRMLPKMKALGHRVLVFTQMTTVLDIMEEYFYLRGYGAVVREHPYEDKKLYAEHEQIVEDAKEQAAKRIGEQAANKARRKADRKAEEKRLVRQKETATQKKQRLARYKEEDEDDDEEVSFEDYLPEKQVEFLRLDGKTQADKRRQLMGEWNEKDSPYWLFILSTKAGGLGLNLQTADTVVIFDSDWNPQMDLQAQDRAHRIGQTREVHVYRLITRGTVEEKIWERADWKLKMDQKVIQAGMFDQSGKSDDKRSRKRLQELFALEDEDEHHEIDEDDTQLNKLIARSKKEEKDFAELDKHRRRNEDNIPRLMQRDELPDYILRGEEDAENERTGAGDAERMMSMFEEQGRGKRERKDVVYDDGLTELQFAKQLEGLPIGKRRRRRRHSSDEENDFESSESDDGGRSSRKRSRSQKKSKKDKKGKKGRRSSSSSSSKGKPAKKRRRTGNKPDKFLEEESGWRELDDLTANSGALRWAMFQFWAEQQEDEANDLINDLPEKDSEIGDLYYNVTEKPLSLGVIRQRLERDLYPTAEAFASDFVLLSANTLEFNQEGTPLYEAAEALKDATQAWLKEHNDDEEEDSDDDDEDEDAEGDVQMA